MAIDHYNAFISYRHNDRDSAVASAIQSKLERFRIPPAVQKTTGIRKIDRIFRDKEELPITSDLGADIDEALSISDFLIVICSPELKESRWCMREIEVFLSSHPRQRVLTVVTEGEPPDVIPGILLSDTIEKTSKDGSTVTETVDVEPLACDYRRPAASRSKKDFRTAEREELPRLAAALIGCSYDELVRRQHQYRMRRMAALGSLVLALSAGAIAYLLWSRNEIRENYQQSLISQSHELASQSLSALSDEDRVTAVSLALSALPSEELDRPVTAEAEYALTEAMQIYSSSTALTGTRIFRARDEITDFSYSSNGAYLLAMDKAGGLTVWDVASRERIAVWEISSAEDLPGFAALPGNRAVVWGGSVIFCMDYLTGDQVWAMDLSHPGVFACLSPDGKSIFACNQRALLKLDCGSGDILDELSLDDLPDGLIPENGFFFGIRVSPSGESASVLLRLGDGSDACGLFLWDTNAAPDHKTGGLFPVSDEIYRDVSAFGFADETHLYLCHRNGAKESFEGATVTTVGDDPVRVTMVSAESGVLWSSAFDIAQVAGNTIALPAQYRAEDSVCGGLLVALGQTAVMLDAGDGAIVLRRDLGDIVISVSAPTPDGYSAVLSDGQTASVTYDPLSTVYMKQYAGGIKALHSNPAPDTASPEAAALRNGEILLYETEISPVYTATDGDAALQMPRETAVTPAGYLAVLTERPSLLVIDPERNSARDLVLPGSAYTWTIAGIREDGSILLAANADESNDSLAANADESNGSPAADAGEDSGLRDGLTFAAVDPAAAQPVIEIVAGDGQIAADYGMFFADFGNFFSMSGDRILYVTPQQASLDDGSSSGDSLTLADTVSGSLSRLTVKGLSGTQSLRHAYRRDLISYGSLVLPSPVFASPDGSLVFTTCYDAEDDLNHGLLVSTETGEAAVLPKLLYDGLLKAAWNGQGDRIAVSGHFLINVYDREGTVLHQIPHPGRQVLSLCWRGEELMALFSDHVLERYDPEQYTAQQNAPETSGDTLSVTALDMTDPPIGIYEHFSWNEENERLYLIADGDLFIIDAAAFPSVQSARAKNCLAVSRGKIWNITPEIAADGATVYRAGFFTQPGTAELTELGRKLVE